MPLSDSEAEQALAIALLDQKAKDVLTMTTAKKEAKLTELMAVLDGPVNHPRLFQEIYFGAA